MSLLKKDSLLTHLLIMAGVSLLLIVLLIFGLDLYTHHGETVKVPDLRGKTLAEMQRILDDVGLKYEINDSTYSSTAIPGTVREVVPAPGSEVKSGRIIFIAINGFHQRLQTIPIYKDQSARQILSLLKGLGFESVEQRVVAGRYSGSVVKLETADGKLVEAGTQLRIDTKLILFVAGQAIDTLGLDRYIEDYSKGGSDSTAGSSPSPEKKDDGGISNDWW